MRLELLFIILYAGSVKLSAEGFHVSLKLLSTLGTDPQNITEVPKIREGQHERCKCRRLHRPLHPLNILGLADESKSQVQVVSRAVAAAHILLFKIMHNGNQALLYII